MFFLTETPFVFTSIVIGIIVLFITLALIYRHLCKKVGPHEALIVVGPKGTKVIAGGSLFVNPLSEKYQIFPLELMSFPVSPDHALYTAQGISIMAEAVTQVKVNSNQPESIRTAAEQFLSKSVDERTTLIRQVMEGHLRHIVGHLAVEDLVRNTDYVSTQMIESVHSDLEKMGLLVISFTLKEVHDDHNYIQNLGLPHIEDLKKQTAIATASAQRDAATAKATSDQERVRAEIESLIHQAEFQRNLKLQQVIFEAEILRQQAVTDQAYDLQASQQHLLLIAEHSKVQQAEQELALLEMQSSANSDCIDCETRGYFTLNERTSSLSTKEQRLQQKLIAPKE